MVQETYKTNKFSLDYALTIAASSHFFAHDGHIPIPLLIQMMETHINLEHISTKLTATHAS
jgi:hypothetical protein